VNFVLISSEAQSGQCEKTCEIKGSGQKNGCDGIG